MKPSISIDTLSVEIPVDHPKRRSSLPSESIAIEIRTDSFWTWDIECRLQSTIYAYDPAGNSLAYGGIGELPHLDEVYRYVAEQYVANRSNLVGTHLGPAVNAMEAAIATRDGASVYFADAGGQIKIGWSRKVSARLAQLQVGCASPLKLLGTMPGGMAIERRIHERFAHLRLSGEWFVAAPELLAYIAEGRTTAEHQAQTQTSTEEVS